MGNAVNMNRIKIHKQMNDALGIYQYKKSTHFSQVQIKVLKLRDN